MLTIILCFEGGQHLKLDELGYSDCFRKAWPRKDVLCMKGFSLILSSSGGSLVSNGDSFQRGQQQKLWAR